MMATPLDLGRVHVLHQELRSDELAARRSAGSAARQRAANPLDATSRRFAGAVSRVVPVRLQHSGSW